MDAMSQRRKKSGRGVVLRGGPLDGQITHVPLEEGRFDVFAQLQDQRTERDPDDIGHRYVVDGHRWVYGGTVTARQADAESDDAAS